MEDRSAEIRRLQSCLNDLVSVLALPAISKGQDSSQIVIALLEGLVVMLRLDFAYARLGDSVDAEPMEEVGLIIAPSQRSDFPKEIEMSLLRVAANQAAICLQESRHLGERKRAATELEHRVAERTRQLTAVNQELVREIAEREHAQEEQRKLASLVEHSTDFIGIASPEGRDITHKLAEVGLVSLNKELAVSNEELRLTTDELKFSEKRLQSATRKIGRFSSRPFKAHSALRQISNASIELYVPQK